MYYLLCVTGNCERKGMAMKYQISEQEDNYIDTGEMDTSFFLIGLLNEFMNRFQTVGDAFFKEISWKQCFVIICINLCEDPPTLRELSELMGSSHQNVKQMLLKLEKIGFVEFIPDEKDKRKQRIVLTEKAKKFSEEYDEASDRFMQKLFQTVNKKNLAITIDTIMKLDTQLKKMK